MGPPDLLMPLQTDTTVLDQLSDSRLQRAKQRRPMKFHLGLEAKVQFTTCHVDLPPPFRRPKYLDALPIRESKPRNGNEKYDAFSWREVRSFVFDLCQEPLCALDQRARWTDYLGGIHFVGVDGIFIMARQGFGCSEDLPAG